jgi:cytochrome c
MDVACRSDADFYGTPGMEAPMLRIATVIAVIVAATAARVAAGENRDAESEGRRAFNNHCRTCHSTRKDDHRIGPSMHGIFGAPAGQIAGFRGYSGGLTGINWDEKTLDQFIADPTSVSSNTNMIYPPVRDRRERRKIIEFLRSLSDG